MTTTLPVTAGRQVVSDSLGWLTVYLVLLLFVPSRLIVGALGSAGAPSMLFGLGSMLLWLVYLLDPRRRALAESQPIRVALFVLLFSVGVTFTLAMSRPIGSDEVSPAQVAVLSLASWSGTLLLSHDHLRDRSRIDILVWRFAVCGGLIAALGLIQVATRKLWVDRLSIPGLFSSPGYGLSDRGGYPRPAGTSIHPIEYGVLLAIALPLALHVGFQHTSRRPLVRWLPAAALAAIIPLTSSRSAYLGAVIAIGVCMIGWSKRRRILMLALAGLGFLVMSVIASNFVRSIIGLFTGVGDDPSITSRTDSFALAIEFIDRHPWFGRGLGTFLPKYRIFDDQYLLLLVTVGVVGTLAFLALGVTTVVVTTRLRARLQDESSRDLALALCSGTCAGFACLLMFDAFAFPMTMGALFLVIGMAGALRRCAIAAATDPTEVLA